MAPIPDEAPGLVKDALACRNTVARTGRCPACGECCVPWPPRVPTGTVTILKFEHRDGCPALLEGVL